MYALVMEIAWYLIVVRVIVIMSHLCSGVYKQALVTTIVGTAKIGNNAVDVLETGSGRLLMDTNANIALWIIDAALLPVVILSGILTFIFSRIA